MIEVRLFATLREGREKIIFYEKDKFSNGKELLKFLEINEDDVAIFLINGRHNKIDTNIKDDDVIAIFPPVGGG